MHTRTTKVGEFTNEEREAMRARAKELKAEAKAAKTREQGEKEILDAIYAMSNEDKVIAKQIHEIVTSTAPELFPKTWYGMPAYANTAGKIICFFQASSKFKTRYSSFGFNEDAKLDNGNMWATSFAVKKITSAEENIIIEMIKRAV